MIRRFPVSFGALALSGIVASYVAARHSIARAAERAFYVQVEQRLTQSGRAFGPSAGERWFGMYRPELPWDYHRFNDISRELGVRPRIVSFYQAWGEGPEHVFKTDAIEAAFAHGLVPLITWEPWLSDFGKRSHEAPAGSVERIVKGDYDDYVRAYAVAVTRARKPLFLRPFHEVGNPWYGWSTTYNPPGLVAEAYRHVVRIFREQGAKNAVFVWTPYTPQDDAAWPGDDWVDWIGLDVFNFGALSSEARWDSFADVLSWQRTALKGHDKPWMLAEIGCSELGGDQAAWWQQAFETLAHDPLPNLGAIVVYDNPRYTSHESRTAVHLGISSRADIPRKLSTKARAARLEGAD
ncbi:MAG: glycosyl hydrolase [Polyangiaceae bacterium]